MARGKAQTKRSIESYEHRDKERVNNPPAGLVTPENDPDAGQTKKRYAYDPHLDPQLVWAGKAEHTSFEVSTVSLHVHERIDPRTIIEAVRKRNGQPQPTQISLFEAERREPLSSAIEFYQHKHGWSNRLIAGDSLLVMNSLLEKEGLAGKVQMIYIDPPYGIKYASNFQPFVNRRDVKDKDDDLTAEPEQIKAFRDTWELGIHSYLTYLRDRLLLARELLTESGSIFVQISDENVHRVRCLMDEVFGAENFVSLITFRKTGGLGSGGLTTVSDFILWYAKNRQRLKCNPLFVPKENSGTAEQYSYYVDTETGQFRSLRKNEKPPFGVRLFQPTAIHTMYAGVESCLYQFELDGKRFRLPQGRQWSTTLPNMMRLYSSGRLFTQGNTPRFVRYLDDFPVTELTNLWADTMGSDDKLYVVQTNLRVIQRCLLMTTDPGDLVFDPTCGSGTTAYVAEQWGRRWITCDTSRVALAIARQRLMTAVFDYYELAHPEEGVSSGFKYKTVPHVTLKSIANNPEIDGIYARMHPAIEQALAALNAALKALTPYPSPRGRGEYPRSPSGSGEYPRSTSEGGEYPRSTSEGGEYPRSTSGSGEYPRFKVTNGGREGHFVDFAAPDSDTFTMPSGQVVKVNALVEWEVPFEFPADWPEAARQPFEAFHAARRAMQKAMDEAIARHAEQETLYDQPYVDRKKVRVTGPFTVEAVPAPVVRSPDDILEAKPQPADSSVARSGETLRQAEWRDELLKTGIRGKAGQYIRFSRLEPLPGCRWLHAVGETRPSDEGRDSVREAAPAYMPMRVAVSFGPEHAPLEPRQVQRAWEEAQRLNPRPQLLVFAAFQFDPEAAKDIDQMKPELAGMQFLKVQMNADLLTDDLKKKRASNESFWLIGQPDVEVRREPDGKYVVEVHGFDYYNTKTGQIESGGKDKIALWMLDTDYDGRSLYPRQVFFPMAGDDEGWAKLARNLKAEIDPERIRAYWGTASLPFEPGEYKRIAVKIVDDRGIESMRVIEVEG